MKNADDLRPSDSAVEKETFWTAWQAAHEAMSPAERAAEQAELAPWHRASDVDLRTSERIERA